MWRPSGPEGQLAPGLAAPPHPPRRDRRDPRRENQLHGAGQGTREIPDRHRPEPAPRTPGQVRQQGCAGGGGTATRTAAVITLANTPALTSANTGNSPLDQTRARGTGRHPDDTLAAGMPQRGTTDRAQNPELGPTPECLNPVALARSRWRHYLDNRVHLHICHSTARRFPRPAPPGPRTRNGCPAGRHPFPGACAELRDRVPVQLRDPQAARARGYVLGPRTGTVAGVDDGARPGRRHTGAAAWQPSIAVNPPSAGQGGRTG